MYLYYAGINRSCSNSVEPLMSANSAVTVLRSPSIAPEVSACSGATRTPAANSGAVDRAATEPALSGSAAPHLPQKSEVGGFSVLHFAQGLVSAFPHRAQKLLTGGLLVSHFEQRIESRGSGRLQPLVSPHSETDTARRHLSRPIFFSSSMKRGSERSGSQS